MNYGNQQPEINSWQREGQVGHATSYSNAAPSPAPPAPPSTALSLLEGLEMMASDMRQHAESAESLADRISGAVPTPPAPGAKLNDKPPMALIDRLELLSNDLGCVRSRMQEALGRAHARIG